MKRLFITTALVGLVACGDSTSSQNGGGGHGTGANGHGGSGASSQGGNGNGGHPAGGGGGGPLGGGGTSQGGNNPGGGGPGGMGPGYTCDDPVGSPPALTLTPLGQLPGPAVQITSAPGEPDRLFVVDQHGYVRIVDNGTLLGTPFIDVHTLVGGNSEEQGLLGIAFHPDYATNGRFFLDYTDSSNGCNVSEFHVSADPLVADPTPVQLVDNQTKSGGIHNGGALAFGNDGYLYVSLGDSGADCDPGCTAMDSTTLLGKVLRLDVDSAPTGSGYPAAPGNPNGERFYHQGLRNPWRMSLDACTGNLYIGDVGQSAFEEVDVATQAAGALNFGWPIREGNGPQPTNGCGYDGSCTQPASTADPAFQYDHNFGCAIIGGVVYRGVAMPGLRGSYFYGDYCSGAISILQASGGVLMSGPTDVDLNVSTLSAFGIDGNGEVYAASVDGTFYRIDPG